MRIKEVGDEIWDVRAEIVFWLSRNEGFETFAGRYVVNSLDPTF